MPKRYIAKTSFKKGSGIPMPAIDKAITDLQIASTGYTNAGNPTWFLDQAKVDQIIAHLKDQGKVARDFAFDVSRDPRARENIPGLATSAPPPPGAPPAAPASPGKDLADQERMKAVQEYGPPTSDAVFRFMRRKPGGGGYKIEGDSNKMLSIPEIEDQYGPGLYNIERREQGTVTEAWRGIEVGDVEDPEVEEEEEGGEGLFPEPEQKGETISDAIEALSKAQENIVKIMQDTRNPEDKNAATSMLEFITQTMSAENERHGNRIEEMDKRAQIREKDAENAHARSLEKMKEEGDLARQRDQDFILSLDKNSKELQAAITKSNKSVEEANSRLGENLQDSINSQRDALREERNTLRDDRTRVMNDVEDLSKRIREFGPNSPIYGLIQHGLSEARNVTHALIGLRSGKPLPAGLLGPPGPENPSPGGANPSEPDQEDQGIFDSMRQSRSLKDFLSMVASAIEGDGNPDNLADAFVNSSFRDATGQTAMVLNFFMSADAPKVVRVLRPAGEVCRVLESSRGRKYWIGFRDRLTLTMQVIRGQAAGEPPPDASDSSQGGAEEEDGSSGSHEDAKTPGAPSQGDQASSGSSEETAGENDGSSSA